jgi:signal transduction histidine kinase
MATPLSADARAGAEPVALPRSGGVVAALRPRVTPWLATALALPVAVALAVQLALSSDHLADTGLVAVYRAYLVAAPVLIGLVWWRRRPASAYGPLLAVLGLAAVTLGVESSDRPALFTLGVVGESLYFSLFVYLCVAFPAGRLQRTDERVLVGLFVLATVLFTVPRMLLTGSLSSGTGALVPCDPACPANPFQIADAPGVAQDFVRAALALATASAAGLAATLVERLRAASRPQRRELVAVASTTFPFLPALVLVCLGALLRVSESTMAAVSWVFAAAVIVFCLGFLVALIQAELFAGRALRRLLLELAGLPSPPRWRGAVAAALDDPSLRLGYWDPARHVFREPDGDTLERPASDDGRRFTVVEHEGRPVAAMTTDAALGDHPELLAAAAQATLIAVRTGHLEGELRDSRRRLLDAGTTERRRIQRDLHDSAQQRLVALRVHLELAAADLDGPPESRAALRGLGAEVDEALADVRRVASGLYPPVLERQGVLPALRSACAHTRMPIRFVDEGVGRHSATIESTLFFCCLEAVQNAAKHAGPDAEAIVRLGSCDVGVWFCVDDDGVGFAYPPEHGTGLAGLEDRVAALGGTIDVETAPGRGTRVTGRFEA